MPLLEMIFNILSDPDTQAAILVTLVVLAMIYGVVKVAKILGNAIDGFSKELRALTKQLAAEREAYIALQTNVISLHTQQVTTENTRNSQQQQHNERQQSHNGTVALALNEAVDKLVSLDSKLSTNNAVVTSTKNKIDALYTGINTLTENMQNVETLQKEKATLDREVVKLNEAIEHKKSDLNSRDEQLRDKVAELLVAESNLQACEEKQAEEDEPAEKSIREVKKPPLKNTG